MSAMNTSKRHLNRFGEALCASKLTELAAIKAHFSEKLGIGPQEFDRLLGLLAADPSYFKLELVQTATKLAAAGYRRRNPENQCYVNGEPVYHVLISQDPDEQVYAGYVPVRWSDVKPGDEVYMDNYVHGRYQYASEKISGPYFIVSVHDRRFMRDGKVYIFREERLLKLDDGR